MARGIAAGVIAFVVGAWAVGLAIGKDRPAEDRETGPASPETSLAPSEEPSVMGEVEDRPRPSDGPSDRTTAPADVVPAAETADVDDPTTDAPEDDGSRTPKPAPKPSTSPRPSPSDNPTKTPSPSPTPTGPDCRDLSEVLDCVLAPITTKP